MINERWIGKEVVVAHFDVLSWHSPGGIVENYLYKKLDHNSWYLAQDLNRTPPEYKLEGLQITQFTRYSPLGWPTEDCSHINFETVLWKINTV
jgi:hypothetical protein